MAVDQRHRFRELLRSRLVWIAVAWIGSLVGAGVLYLRTPEFAGVAGVVEVVDYRVAAPETLRIVDLPVEVGTRVRKGDVLATLDSRPLSLERDLVRAELNLTTVEARFRQITDDRSFAQAVATAEQALSRETVEATRVQADLDAVRKRLAWWKRQVAAGTAPGLETEDLGAEEAALATRLRSHRDAVATLQEQLKGGRERMTAWRGKTGEGSGDAGAGEADPAKAAVRVAEARLALLESRLEALTLRAPADGVVQRVDARAGDVSQAGQTVVLIREDIPRRVFAYPSASQAGMLRVGAPAWIAARDTGGTDRFPAHVVAIGPGVVPYPDVLQNRMTSAVSFGQAVILHLDGPTPLAPGQVVDVSLLKVDVPVLRDPTADADASPRAPAAGPRTEADPKTARDASKAAPAEGPVPMVVPEALARTSRFEPSAIAWIPNWDGFLVVSDDTGFPDRDDHAPWVFRMDRDGHVDPRPVPLDGAPEVSDLESVARTADGHLWLLSSQSVSRKGNRPPARTRLLQVDEVDGRLVVRRETSLATALARLDGASLEALGLAQRDDTLKRGDFDRVLNVEGLAGDGSALLIGLKQPQDGSGRAILWRVSDPDSLVRTGRFAPGDPAPWARVALPLGQGPDAGSAGISDLAPLPGGGLVVLGTAPPGSGLGDRGGVWVTTGPATPVDGLLPLRKVREFPGLKPEGVAVGPGPGELTIVFDENTRTPHWIRIPIPR